MNTRNYIRERTMEHKGFRAQIMEAERLTGESVHSLPPGTALPVYPVDVFLNAPENWIKTGGFVVPVRPNRGLWFDWTMNSRMNTAIIPTVKGCNPITGLQSSGFHLERYETKCPKHGCDFLAEKFCPECNYKWSPQNYVSYPNTLWWDTWSVNGVEGRQFFFSEDELRDIATHFIGEKNTVPAFGFAFYSPKEPRIEQTVLHRSAQPQYMHTYLSNSAAPVTAYNLTGFSAVPCALSYCCESINIISATEASLGTETALEAKMKNESGGVKRSGRGFSKSLSNTSGSLMSPISDGGMDALLTKDESLYLSERSVEPSKPVKEVSIGAGAKISQVLIEDCFSLDTWRETPDAVMTIYFVFQEKFEELKAGGMRDLEGVKNGMLEGLPIG